MSYAPTQEQKAIVDAARTGADIVINAGAGGGKTSTTRLIARAKPNLGGAYLAFNKSVAAEAEHSFPSTVAAGTTHKFAYRALGYRYKHRLKSPRMKAKDIAALLGVTAPLVLGTDVPKLAPAQVARMVMGTIKRFTYSGDRHLTRKHMPPFVGFEADAARDALAQAIGPWARKAWLDIAAIDGMLPFDGDCYIKLWQLTDPMLRYDYIIVDEAQDLNRALAAVIDRQTHAQRILVGDRYQAINQWRLAIDAMEGFAGDRFNLTKSFRFGPEVAYEANKWLRLLGSDMELTGFDKIASRVEACPGAEAILCRTNAATLVAATDAIKAGRSVAIVGGGGDLARYAKAAMQLKAGEPCDHPELVTFATWREVQEYCDHDAGDDLATMVRLIDKLGPEEIIRLVDGLADESVAEVTISTAHKAKGREWKRVRVSDDFHEPRPDPITRVAKLDRADAMLAYVTVTRAQEVLDRGSLEWVDRWLKGPPRAADLRTERQQFADLLDASSLGAPEVREAIAVAQAEQASTLTGMPEEQADWESDEPTPRKPSHPGACHGICTPQLPNRCLWATPAERAAATTVLIGAST